jgi:hypothetical protein
VIRVFWRTREILSSQSLTVLLLPRPTPSSKVYPPYTLYPRGRSTAGRAVTATKRSIVHNARRGIAPPPCAWSIEMGQCLGTRPPPGAVSPSRSQDQEAARSNRRASLISVPVTSQWCAQEAALTKLRVHDGLLVANMVEDHHGGVLHAACSR